MTTYSMGVLDWAHRPEIGQTTNRLERTRKRNAECKIRNAEFGCSLLKKPSSVLRVPHSGLFTVALERAGLLPFDGWSRVLRGRRRRQAAYSCTSLRWGRGMCV